MNQTYLKNVAEICHVEMDKIAHVSQRELVLDFILPRAVEESGQDTRGWRLSPEFMQFMAIWGQYCINEDRLTGELLMEIAMQRLSKGAIIRTIRKDEAFEKAVAEFEIEKTDSENVKEHKRLNYAAKNEEYLAKTVHDLYAPYNPWFALPKEYRKYSNWYDQPGLMDQACWDFVKANLFFCMEQLNNAVWRGHAEKLCVGLLQNISADGKELNGYLWGDNLVKEPLPEIYQTAETLAVRHFGIQKVAEFLLPSWRAHKAFFKKHAEIIDFNALFKNENWDQAAEAARYFGPKKLWWLKTFKKLETSVNREVKNEMLAA